MQHYRELGYLTAAISTGSCRRRRQAAIAAGPSSSSSSVRLHAADRPSTRGSIRAERKRNRQTHKGSRVDRKWPCAQVLDPIVGVPFSMCSRLFDRGCDSLRHVAGPTKVLLSLGIKTEVMAPGRHYGELSEAGSVAEAIWSGRAGDNPAVADSAGPVFVFSGMGPQWWRMGRDLLEEGGPFAHAAAEFDELFAELSGWSVLHELRRDETDSRVADNVVAQPAISLLQIALTAELASYGVHPKAIVGHSLGEVAAAFVSGMLSLADTVKISYHLPRLQTATVGSGGMLAVGLSEAEVLEFIADRESLCVAAVNSPTAVTLAGAYRAIGELCEELTNLDIAARQLRVEVPNHSHLMEPILPKLASELADLTPRIPTVALYSTVTAAEAIGPDWGAEYWCANIRQPVRFADAVAVLIDAGERVFLKGWSPSGVVRQCERDSAR